MIFKKTSSKLPSCAAFLRRLSRVPHPISYTTWLAVAPAAGFNGARLLGRVPSRFLSAIYASVATV